MKTFSFRITQDMTAFYEGEVSIEAKSEKDARIKLNNMSTEEIEAIAIDWEQNTENAEGVGTITIEELI